MKKVLFKKTLLSTLVHFTIIAVTTTSLVTGIVVVKRKSEDKKIASQEKVNDNELAVQMNSIITFENGKSKGDIYIINPTNNNYNEIIKILLDDTKELIYESRELKPGYYIDGDYLKVNLSKGEYNATAYFNAYSDGKYVGKSGVKVKIKILE